MKRIKGFTLIEVMIVVAIIAILSALAITIYQNSVAKAQLSEAFTLTDGLKTDVSTYYAQAGSCPTLGANGFAAAASYNGKYVDNVKISNSGAGCVITAFMRNHTVAPRLQGKQVILTMGGSTGGAISWQCSSDADPVYLPQTCQ
ncbi:type IV pilus assembly protein PilA [Dyella jiangningensis]|uniref:pilin n=1 Tax=Dyella sp. AtDHG13 TaxID=1938897 RepID=UPI000888944E|nr:pilin [Dyella sp. AtDHG13]PXV58208.1 type IV pilus assembly protein PilA [Dyella sp. AtDHG13]SDK11859.1 type IV pilus assembly protein PilA [Dyella jiangningensis]